MDANPAVLDALPAVEKADPQAGVGLAFFVKKNNLPVKKDPDMILGSLNRDPVSLQGFEYHILIGHKFAIVAAEVGPGILACRQMNRCLLYTSDAADE